MDMAGVFEYDLELKEKGEHRKFLTETASFKQARAGETVSVCVSRGGGALARGTEHAIEKTRANTTTPDFHPPPPLVTL